ncbi:LysE family transporter [soil metagenome]
MAILEGYLWGLGMVIFIGPVFFTLLQNTLQRGQTAGIMVALGIIVSDVVAISFCVAGAMTFLHDVENTTYISLFGAAILFAIGGRYLIKPSTNTSGNTKYGGLWGAFGSGFLVNFVNPFVFGVWLTVSSYAGNKYGFGHGLYLYLLGCLLGVLTTDTLKVLLAHRIKAFIKPHRLQVAYRVIGLVMLAFGVRLVLYATCTA